MKKIIGFGLLLALLAPLLPADDEQITVPLRFDHYYTLDQVYDAL